MDRLKKARRPLRAQLTRSVNECNAILGAPDPDKEVLRAKLHVLVAYMESIVEHDVLIRDKMLDENVTEAEEDNEHAEMAKYKESFATVKNKIEALLDPTPTPTESGSDYESASQHAGGGGGKRSFKLPKIELKKFNGDLKQWLGWWSQFEKIDQDEELHAADKIQYLSNAMEAGSEAAELVEGYPHSADNYPKVVEALKERFGRQDLLMQVYLRELLTLVISNVTSKDKIPLSSLYLKLESHLRSLAALNLTEADPATWLFPLVESSLAEETLRVWQRSSLSKEDGTQRQPPKTKLDLLIEFIKGEVRSEQHITLAQSGFQSTSSETKHKPGNSKAGKVKHAEVATAAGLIAGQTGITCGFCEKGHDTDRCVTALSFSLEERKHKIKEKHLCYICLRPGHSAKRCRAVVKCAACGGKHYPILCNKLGFTKDAGKPAKEDSSPMSAFKSFSLEEVQPTAQNSNRCSGDVLLQTLQVQLLGGEKPLLVRMVGDSGSQRSYIRSDIIRKIKSQPVGSEWIQNVVFGGTVTKPEKIGRHSVSLCGINGGMSKTFEFLEKGHLCGKLPRTPYGPWITQLKQRGIELTDVGPGNEHIDILVGNDIWGSLLTETPIVKLENGLYAQQTVFGWTLGGRLPDPRDNCASIVTSMIASSQELSDLWSLEAIGIHDPIEVKSAKELDEETSKHFSESIKQEESGRYIVALPWKADKATLPTNRQVAIRRLRNATYKLKKQEKWEQYDKVFSAWENEGIIHRITDDKDEGHYLPHRPVFKDSQTTPVRPVYDASCRWGQNPSLNDSLHKGPNLLEIIPTLLLRFREYKIGVTADVRKAFQMVRVCDDDRKYQKFLWWEDESCKTLKVYQHDRVVFGINCSPFLLGATINHHLSINAGDLQETAEKLRNSFYVDNCVTSVPSMESYENFMLQSTSLMKGAQMDLRQWAHSIENCSDINHVWSSLEQGENSLLIEKSMNVMVLGLEWDRQTDSMNCAVNNFVAGEKVTKRQILSIVAKVFDPLGFTCPATLLPKLILQNTWSRKVGWDEILPDDISKKFLKWAKELDHLRNIKIPRHIQFDGATKREVHVFNDACQYAYGSVLFMRSEYENFVKVELLIAKSRLAPLKKSTIPRLELMACLVGVRLAKVVQSSMNLEGAEFIYWTDSMTSLAWIQRQLDVGVFVGNRKKEILNTTLENQWNFVPGQYNPADLISRGCSPLQLLESGYWRGPDWLILPRSHWPHGNTQINEDEVNAELRKATMTLIVTENPPFSSYRKNVAVYAWVYKFIAAMKRIRTTYKQHCSIQEMRIGEKLLIMEIQRTEFTQEKMSKLKGLNVKLFEDGLWRVTTRLANRDEPKNFIYPILLPKRHPIVDMLIMDFHKSYCHAGVQFVMIKLREKYWILQSRRTIRRVLSTCTTCRRFRSKPFDVDPVSLPEKRVKDSEAFETTGVDLAGPLFLKDGMKAWVVLYTCAVYRCVHLDVVTSLSNEAFVASLERFISSFGRPNTIYSDNGTNFVGARNIFKSLNWKQIEKECGLKQICWMLNPPTAAWWGGWWEKLVHIMKELLKRMLGKARLSYDGLRTCLAGVCATMNERPLTAMTEDSEDLVPLKPSMFMRGKSVGYMPDGEKSESLTAAYRKMKNLQHQLQDRFRKEYLATLVQRKNEIKGHTIKVGDVVLVGSDNKRRFEWPLGRILQLFPGKDGKIRVAEIRTKIGTLVRPLQRLYPLEVPEEMTVPKEKEKAPETDNIQKTEDVNVQTKSGRIVKRPSRYGICVSFLSDY